eukprot:GILI01007079.1.p1 GENE.GILI01007079.1~~GILI01007079.1.p1  ORF type:complete len:387 (+),score=87.69 GILI01007079.1:1-1161(+)
MAQPGTLRCRRGRPAEPFDSKHWRIYAMLRDWDCHSTPLLVFAAQSCQEDLLALLLAFPELLTDINQTDKQRGRTALHYACAQAHKNAILMLLEAGADPFEEDQQGHSPMVLLALCKPGEAARANANAAGVNAAGSGAEGGEEGGVDEVIVEVLEWLLSHRFYSSFKPWVIRSAPVLSPDAATSPAIAPPVEKVYAPFHMFHVLCMRGYLKSIQFLYSKHFDCGMLDKHGLNGLSYALAFGQWHVARWLVNEGMVVDVKDSTGLIPVQYIASFKNKLRLSRFVETPSVPLCYLARLEHKQRQVDLQKARELRKLAKSSDEQLKRATVYFIHKDGLPSKEDGREEGSASVALAIRPEFVGPLACYSPSPRAVSVRSVVAAVESAEGS